MVTTQRETNPPALPGYTYTAVLGQGGFADVFEYQQDMPYRRVAVKVLLPDKAEGDVLARLRTEANAMAELSQHPNIVTIFGVQVAPDGRPCLIMERYPRNSLGREWRKAKLKLSEVLAIGVQLSGAVESAHRRGILHRDIKPANILFDLNGRPVLSDFGIAANVMGEVSALTGLSVPWSAPESFGDDPLASPQGDVWSLAATLYSLLTGRAPFEVAGTDNATLAQAERIALSDYMPLGRPDAPPELDQVLKTAMAKNPLSRYPTAAAFGNQLRAVQATLGYTPTPMEILRDNDEYGSTGTQAGPDQVGDTVLRAFSGSDSKPSPTAGTPPPPPADALITAIPPAGARPLPASSATERSLGGELFDHTVLREQSRPEPTVAAPRRKPNYKLLAGTGALVVAVVVGLVIWQPWGGGEVSPSGSPTGSVIPTETTGPVPTDSPTPTETAVTASPTTPTGSPLEAGDVYTWGGAGKGLLGDGSEEDRATPGPIPDLNGVTALVAAEDYQRNPRNDANQGYVYALVNDGTIYSWGVNKYGQLGVGTTQDAVSPKQVKNIDTATAIDARCGAAYALLADGTLMGWGQWPVGDGGEADQLQPAPVQDLEGVISMAAACAAGLALTGDGDVYAWGWYTFGVGSSTPYSKTPKRISALSGILQVSAGCNSGYALTNEGKVLAWGQNDKGQLGDGTKKGRGKPVEVSGLSDIVQIVATCDAAYAINANGDIFGWGSQPVGNDGVITTPVAVGAGVVKLQAGYDSVFAFAADGTVYRGDPGAAWVAQDQIFGATSVTATDKTTFAVRGE
ncbi:MAG: protein kinase [Propionibacteriaceae bacterium]|jgi:serine/threonine protein kinase/alpha-tubulin suppressor-like RCC1 family protein|nr:protein kinase [Propionibacteriaceae bacterium]